MDQNILLVLLIAASAILARIPVIGIFFRSANTMIHEAGHAIAALLSSGEVYKIELNKDTSGSCVTSAGGFFNRFFVSIIGYPFSSFTAWLLFYLLKNEHILAVMVILASFAMITLLMWVRNNYGIFWLIIFLAIVFLVQFYATDEVKFYFCFFVSGIILTDSVISTFVLLAINYKAPKNSGDSTNLAKQTKIPSIIWSLLFAVQSLFFLYQVLKLYVEI